MGIINDTFRFFGYQPIIQPPQRQLSLVPKPGGEFLKADGEKESYAMNPLSVAFNQMNNQFGLRKPSMITYLTLRRMSRTNWVDRTCINTLRDEVTGIPWDINPKDDKKPFSLEFKDYLVRLLLRPSKRNNEHWRTLIDKVVEDILVIDAGCIEKVRDQKGRIAELYHIDGATIKPMYDEHGMIGDPIAYKQFIPGQKGAESVADFSNQDLIYMVWNPQGAVDTFGYGMSPVESGLAVGTAFLYAEAYNLGFFQKNTIPPMIINMGEDVPSGEVDKFRSFLASEMMGINGFYTPVIMSGGKGFDVKELLKAPKDMAWQEYVTWQMRWKVALYRMSPQDIGFSLDQYKVEGNVQAQLSKNKAINSLKDIIKQYITAEVIEDEGWGVDPDKINLEFNWIDDKVVDPKTQAEVDKIYLGTGVTNINEIRVRQGLDPIRGGIKSTITVGAQLIEVDATTLEADEMGQPIYDIDEDQSEAPTLKPLFNTGEVAGEVAGDEAAAFQGKPGEPTKDANGEIDKDALKAQFDIGMKEEASEHPGFTGEQIRQIVADHIKKDPSSYKDKVGDKDEDKDEEDDDESDPSKTIKKVFNEEEGLVIPLVNNDTAITWLDDRGVTQPLFVTDFGKTKGFTIKPSFLDERKDQEPPEQRVSELLRSEQVNTPEVKILTYEEVIKLLPVSLYNEFTKWISLEPPYDSMVWRNRWGPTRKSPYYIVTGYVSGIDLSNEELHKTLKASPDVFTNALRDLARVWVAEKKYSLGDRKPGHYIITRKGNGFGVDYSFVGDDASWKATSHFLPDVLEAVNPKLKEIFDKEIMNEAEKFLKSKKKRALPNGRDHSKIMLLPEIERQIALAIQKRMYALYIRIVGKKSTRAKLINQNLKKALDFDVNEPYILGWKYVYQNGTQYPINALPIEMQIQNEIFSLNPSLYRNAFDMGVDQAQAELGPRLPSDMKVSNPTLYVPQFEDRVNFLETTMTDSIKSHLDEVIAQALDEGKTYGEMADRIQNFLGVEDDNPSMPGWRAEMIARTESQWAINEGMREQYDEIGMTHMILMPAADACNDCQDAAADNPYEVSDEDILPVHPNCRCSWVGDWEEFMKSKKETKEVKYDWQSTQFDMPSNLAQEIRDFELKIPDDKISINPNTGEGGRELDPHVTVLYGLANNIKPEQVKSAMGDEQVIEIKLGKTSIFETDKDFDVLKLEVESESLKKLHNTLKSALNAPGYTFPEYQSHITLAYLKKGEGKFYEGNTAFEGRIVYLTELMFSYNSGEKVIIPLINSFEKADDGLIWITVNGRTFPIDPSKQGVDSGFGYKVNKVDVTNYKRTSNLMSPEGAPDKERVDNYKQLLKEKRPITPILVRDNPENPDTFEIEDGKHRFEALRQTGHTFIPTVKVSDWKSSTKIREQYDKGLQRDQKNIEALKASNENNINIPHLNVR